ncbi:hypothetical protein GTS_50960 [Gandjariella thermophila]|uniref:Prepilin type IV endopeptidase peptidase domain-containing protein n=1 Tax=Gandjariella thermophila TaxID=1931992 RepID=A0A4D4JHT7_9PSEU|nr:hypothetical protein GTS_50960 [Gandjariella thermophila]
MSGGALIASWAGVGVLVGAALGIPTRRLLTSDPPRLLAARPTVPVLTAILYAALAWRVGEHFDLLPFSVFVVSGAMLSLIDLVDQRLPSVILYPATTLVGLLLAASTVLHPSTPGFVRALAGMALLAAFYLVLAFLSGGGLGAGDVKLGALLGLTLGWVSWSALITATFFGWLAAALAWLLLRATGRAPADYLLPMGPYLILGAFLAIIMPPT